jgi:hypothetical protein
VDHGKKARRQPNHHSDLVDASSVKTLIQKQANEQLIEAKVIILKIYLPKQSIDDSDISALRVSSLQDTMDE